VNEGSVALITYMRTDSVPVSNDALNQVVNCSERLARTIFRKNRTITNRRRTRRKPTKRYVPPRHARAGRRRKYLDEDSLQALSTTARLLRHRCSPQSSIRQTIDISAGDYTFRATGSVQKFDGYLRVYQMPASIADREDDEKDDEGEGRALPQVGKGKLSAGQDSSGPTFTEPPPRFNDATLVKELEEDGIGRPSTYASTFRRSSSANTSPRTRDFSPTMLGERVSTLLIKSFEDIFDVTFTARLEEELDEIEEGKLPWREAVKEFWEKFVIDSIRPTTRCFPTRPHSHREKCEKCGQGELLETHQPPRFFPRLLALSRMRFHSGSLAGDSRGDEGEPKTEYCDNCGKEMAIKRGRFGTFPPAPVTRTARPHAASSRARAIAHQPDEPLDEKCTLCGNGLVKKHGRFGEFIAAPAIRSASTHARSTMGIKCPRCNEGEFVRRGKRRQKAAADARAFLRVLALPDCDFTTPHMPIAEPCPKCGAPFIVEKRSKIGTVQLLPQGGCDWEKLVPEAQPQAQTGGSSGTCGGEVLTHLQSEETAP